MSVTLRLVPPPVRLIDAPEPNWSHVARLSDDTGLLEHARNATVRREHGYCVDDVARGLLLAGREPQPTALVTGLAERYLAFVTHAMAPDGTVRNRLSFDRRWQDEPGTDDCWGRALWGLGTAAGRCAVPWIRREARQAFLIGARQRSQWSRAMAFAGLGAAEVLRGDPACGEAAQLLADAATVVGLPGSDPGWVWPEQRLSYANPALAEVLIHAGDLLGDEHLLEEGLRMLGWLCRVQEHQGHLSTVPVAGWQPADLSTPDGRHRFDQQPIEAAATADACAAAATATGDDAWDAPLFQAIAWFLGDNDAGIVMYDPLTGGCYDGLTPEGPNLNQGAESTLALVSTLQHARAWAGRSATRPSGGLA
ncbi:glycosyl transferase [Winogradskya consettensis]|uniref:Glycosyl transferase n=1 Tax=Winogradskya consettensis TaxID=113560 RepID=A0A919SWU0_9ACTN|nr:glycosyltransferase [Actinoplanes consettensis]GIM79439.1 glycosyl transferase [Actinoplanes consettensis]